MALNKQVYVYAVGTDAFYDEDEHRCHDRMVKLYTLRKKYKNCEENMKWRKASINRVIAKEKNRLSEILDKRAEGRTPRELNQDTFGPKNVISLFESSLTRALGLQTNGLTEDVFIIDVYFFQVFKNLILDGFIYRGEKYEFLTASAGQIRQKKAVFIKSSEYARVKNKLTCGLTIGHINECGGINPNKYLAYLALNNSATDVWESFNIDQSIVVDDFETLVPGEVDHIDDVTYEIKRRYTETPIPHMDGCGIMLEEKTRMCRMPWVKGLLVQFPFDKFIQEKCGGDATVYDIYGERHDIIAEGIKYIFTKSQFKMAKYYRSWNEYKENFKKYGCEACYCNIEEDYIPKARINYQMLQTLTDMTDDEIQWITRKSIEEIDAVGNDFKTTMRLLGATEYNQNKSYMQEALMIYPELFKDAYNRDILKQTKNSLVKQAKAGRLRVNGHYTFLSPDLYAFCEWLFLGEQNPRGILADGEVYCRDFANGDELACLRSPHLYREWSIKQNVKNEELNKWFGCTKCVYTSCHDLISRILMFDVDGDKTLVVRDRNLIKIAKRNMRDIVPLAYELKKAKGAQLSNEAFFNGMAKAFTTGNIGPISNNITKIWNNDKITQQEIDVVKWLCFENNAVIDCAKTSWLPKRPYEIDKIIKSYTKANVPHFFIYAKDKTAYQVEPTNNSPMNRLSDFIPDGNIKYNKSISKFDYRMLMNQDTDYTVRENSEIITAYNYWLKHQNKFGYGDDTHINENELYKYRQIRQEIINAADCNIDYIVNSLVAYVYTLKKNGNKKMLWACFGDVIVANLKNNVSGKICPICGKRFEPRENANTVYCSDECARIGKQQYDREYRKMKKLKNP